MVVLGVSDGPVPAAAVATDGRVVGVGAMEPGAAIPWEAMEEALRCAGLGPADVVSVQIAGRWSSVAARRGIQAPLPVRAGWIAQAALRATGFGAAEADRVAQRWEVALAGRGYRPRRVAAVEVHAALAHAAYRSQSADRVSIAVWEPLGDGLFASVWTASSGFVTKVVGHGGLDGQHLLERGLAARLGLPLGLADHPAWAFLIDDGTAEPALVDAVARAFAVTDGRWQGASPPWAALQAAPQAVARASARRGIDRGVADWLSQFVDRRRPLVLAGRGFADPRLVEALHHDGFDVTAGAAVCRYARAAGAALRALGPAPAAPQPPAVDVDVAVARLRNGEPVDLDVGWERWRIGTRSALPGALVALRPGHDAFGPISDRGVWALRSAVTTRLLASVPDLVAARVGAMRGRP